jgi:hypothetical protein
MRIETITIYSSKMKEPLVMNALTFPILAGKEAYFSAGGF